jgi:hypothetical protein
MAEEKEKAIQKEQKTNPPAGAKKDELSDEELKKAAGGNAWPVKHVMPS